MTASPPDMKMLQRKCYTDTIHKHIDARGKELVMACLAIAAIGLIFFFVGLTAYVTYKDTKPKIWWAWAAMWGAGIILIIIPLAYVAWKHMQIESCLMDYTQNGDEQLASVKCSPLYPDRSFIQNTVCTETNLRKLASNNCPRSWSLLTTA